MSTSEDRMLRHFLHTMAGGFVLLLILLLAVVGYTLVQLDSLADDMERIVRFHNQKEQIATDMQVAGYRRSDALYNFALTDDPFERDAYFLDYNRAGFDVGLARNALRDMGLGDGEQVIMNRQSALIEQVIDGQEKVIDLITADDPEARQVLQDEVLPVQADINQTFAMLRDINSLAATQVLDETHESTRSTLLVAIFLGAACLVLGVGTALLVFRHTSRQSQQITEHVAELEQARKAADKANRAKSDFLAVMSHEIRTPMNGVLGMVDLMRSTELNDTQSDYLETIASSGEILLTLLNDVLDLSKIEAGHLELEEVDFQLHRLIESVIMLMSGKAHLKGLKIEAEIDPDVPMVLKGDPTRLRQILFNLLSNAVKFTDQGRILVKVGFQPSGRNEYHLRLAVSDTGIGISEEAKEHLFDAFSQADTSIARRFGGTGLGLAICKRLVGAMGGNIKLTSHTGEGSEFYFDVPFEVGDPEALKHVAAERPFSPKGQIHGGLHVLLVDDDEVNQRVGASMLEHLGHTANIAGDGEHALDAISKGQFDVVLMDMQMPGMDGLETTRRIRALNDPSRSQVPIIALTASISSDLHTECAEAGMNGVLSKPIKRELLFQELSQFEAQSPRTRLSDSRSIDEIIADNIDQTSLEKMRQSIGDQAVQELVQIFETSSHQVLDELSRAWEKGDYSSMAIKAHRLRGSSLSLGLSALAMLARDTEKAAEDGRAASVRELIIRLTTVRDRSMEELNRLLRPALAS
ncbi:MAG: ATP-binding protein [Gammaproteobacteria bacterium]